MNVIITYHAIHNHYSRPRAQETHEFGSEIHWWRSLTSVMWIGNAFTGEGYFNDYPPYSKVTE
jgi:hypothetical protein